MDILLTKDSSEIQAIVIGLEYGRISTDHDVIQAAIEEACRAQLRKVVEWMTKHWIEARKLDGAVQLTIEESDWQALRAAGEGK
jgi:hypothetical protein